MTEALANSLNQPTTLLTGNITSGSTTIPVNAPGPPDAWPTTDQFRVKIDFEIITVTAATGSATSLTVVQRGVEGTTAASHSSGASVDMVLTIGGLLALIGAIDGWINDSSTAWTYASGSGGGTATFTVNNDLRSTFTKGTRIKLTQSSVVKYFVVIADSTYVGGGTNQTTVTMSGGTDYTLANAVISGNYHSYQANPQGYPGWFNFAPVLSGFSGTPTVNKAIFAVTGNAITLKIDATGTSNSTSTGFTAPVATVDGNNDLMGPITDNGAGSVAIGDAYAGAATAAFGVFTNLAGQGWTASGLKAFRIYGTYKF